MAAPCRPWACDTGQLKYQGGGGSTADILEALNRCELSLWILYDTIRGSCKDISRTPDSSEATGFDGLESLAAAKRLIRQIHTVLSSLAQRQRPESPRKPRAYKVQESPCGSVASSQASKYVCTGSGGQHNTIQEGDGYQVITNSHKFHGRGGSAGS